MAFLWKILLRSEEARARARTHPGADGGSASSHEESACVTDGVCHSPAFWATGAADGASRSRRAPRVAPGSPRWRAEAELPANISAYSTAEPPPTLSPSALSPSAVSLPFSPLSLLRLIQPLRVALPPLLIRVASQASGGGNANARVGCHKQRHVLRLI